LGLFSGFSPRACASRPYQGTPQASSHPLVHRGLAEAGFFGTGFFGRRCGSVIIPAFFRSLFLLALALAADFLHFVVLGFFEDKLKSLLELTIKAVHTNLLWG
jgi:hypothetical protein